MKKAGDRPNEARLIADAIAQFPNTFSLRAFPGKVFRISPSASYTTAIGIILYVQQQQDDRWIDFCKGTPEELSGQVV